MAKKVTVLGAGNAGHALAFEITQNGGEVLLFEHPDFTRNLEGIKERGGIEAVATLPTAAKEVPAMLSGFSKIHILTSDPEEAMTYADIIALIVPQFAQETIFKLIMPYLRDGQIIVLLPGNYGSLIFRQLMYTAGIEKRITFVETTSVPYAVRILGPGRVYIEGKKTIFHAAALPANHIDQAIEILRDVLFLKIIPLENVLESGMSNPNMIMHVATAVLGMGPMESRQGQVQFYAEGCSPAVSKVLEQEDKERINIGKAYGLRLMKFVEIVNDFYNLQMKNIRDFAANTPIHNRMPNDSPRSPQEHYITEDCASGLVPIHEFGTLAGIPCPIIDSIINICNVYNDTNYFREGLTLEKLGLAGMGISPILRYVDDPVALKIF